MPKTFNNSLRVLLSRAERRALDRAARHRGMPTGRFARLAALYVAQECPQANLVRVHIRNGPTPPPEPPGGETASAPATLPDRPPQP